MKCVRRHLRGFLGKRRRLPLTVSFTVLLMLSTCRDVMDRVPGRSGAGTTLDFVEELRIGVEDGDPDYLFGRIHDLAVNSQGHLFVLDGQHVRVQEYDSNGVYVRTLGRKGEGPGEFHFPQALAVDAADSLFVADWGQIWVFDEQGRPVRLIRTLPWFPQDVVIDAAHNIYYGAVDLDNHTFIHAYRNGAGVPHSFGATYREKGIPDAGAHCKRAVERMFGGGRLGVDAKNRILFSRRIPYVIQRFTSEGRLLDTITRSGSFPRLLGTIVCNNRLFDPRSGKLALTAAVVPLPDGRILHVVLEPLPSGGTEGDRRTLVDLFTESGSLLASRHFDFAVSLQCADRDGRLYGVELAEFPQVVRYRLRLERTVPGTPP